MAAVRAGDVGVSVPGAAGACVSAVRFPGLGATDGLSGGFQSLFTLGFAGLLLLGFWWNEALARPRPVRALAGVGLFSCSLYLVYLLALGIVTQGVSRLGAIGAHGLLLYAVKLALCVAAGRLFFQVCEHPFLDTHQTQVRRERQARQKKSMVQ